MPFGTSPSRLCFFALLIANIHYTTFLGFVNLSLCLWIVYAFFRFLFLPIPAGVWAEQLPGTRGCGYQNHFFFLYTHFTEYFLLETTLLVAFSALTQGFSVYAYDSMKRSALQGISSVYPQAGFKEINDIIQNFPTAYDTAPEILPSWKPSAKRPGTPASFPTHPWFPSYP